MTCAEFDRWLDEGMTEDGSTAALTHARTCPRCSALLDPARSIETAFLADEIPVRAPAGFSSSVMTRVRALEAAGTHELVKDPPSRWWIALLTDPVASVSLTVSLLALAMLIWSPAWTLRMGAWIGAHWLTWVGRSGGISLEPLTWGTLAVVACPFVVWWTYTLGRGLERSFVLYLVRSER